jgi:hypothetical protein
MQSTTWVRIKEGDSVGAAAHLIYPAWCTIIFDGDVVETSGSDSASKAEHNGYDKILNVVAPRGPKRAGEHTTVQVNLFAGPGGFAGVDFFIWPKGAPSGDMKFLKYLRVDPQRNPPGLPRVAAASAAVCFLVE